MTLGCAIFLGQTPARAKGPSVRVIFVGDIMLDGGPGHVITNGGDPFAPVGALLHDADATVGNLECAIVTTGHAVDKPYTFRGPATALPLLKQYFSGVSLANNHSADWGKQGFASELDLLKSADVAWFGGGRNRAEAHAPLILQRNGLRIALLGYNEFPPRAFAATTSSAGTAWLVESEVIKDIRAARVTQRADVVIPFLHWGHEFDETPDAQQQALARRLIDAGADAVVGSHPHVTQTVDWYNGHPIIYSLGNFVFDYYPNDPEVWKGWIIRLTFEPAASPQLEIFPVTLDAAGVPKLVDG